MRAKNQLAPCARVVGVFFLVAQTFAFAQAHSGTAASAAWNTPKSNSPDSIGRDFSASTAVTSTPVPADFFDMTTHAGVLDGAEPWPEVPIYGLRLWETNTAWAQINTANGTYDWTDLDEWIAAGAANNAQLMYTFGYTPQWASSDPNDESCDEFPGSCWPPADLNSDGTGTDQDWINFVSAIAQHAPSIQYWEMWNTPHDTGQWNGTDAQLVRMVQDANTYIKMYIPNAVIISPANGQLNYTYPGGNCTMPDLMAGYLAAGLGQYIDVLAFHTYYTTVPEDIIPVIQCYQSVMATYNISSMPLWSTEGAWGTDSELTSATAQAGFLARLYLLLWSNGVQRHYWYAWDDATTGTLEVNSIINTPGIAYGQVETWMTGRTMTTPCAESSSDIWTCGFTGANGYVSQAVWYPGTGKKTYTVPAGFINYLSLAGVETSVKAGDSVTLGLEPILLQNQTTTVAEPSFAVSLPTPFPAVNAGSTGTSGPITISSQFGFSGTVSLSCVTTYGSGSCSITPATVSLIYPATATLVINGTSFTAGSYQVEVQGKSGSITQTLNVPFTVGDFTLSGPATLTSAASVTANLSLASVDSYSGQINATCNAAALSGATCTLSPANPIAVASGATVPVTATVTVPSAAASGTYNIIVTAADASGAPSHSLTMALTVSATAPPSSFTLGAITPATQSVNPGQSATYNFSVQPVGGSFSSAVSLTCSGAPATATCSFSPSSVTPGSSGAPVVMTIATTGSSSSVRPRRTLFYALWLALPGFVLFSSRNRRARRRGAFVAVSLLAVGLALSLASCGGGSGGGGSTTTTTGGSGGSGGSSQSGTPAGTYSITVTGTSGSLTSQAPAVTLMVN